MNIAHLRAGLPIIPLTGESLHSLPAWQGDLNPQHGDWLQLQGCVRDRSSGKCAGAWRRRTKGGAPGGVGSGGVRASAAGEEWPELFGESPGVGVRELAGVKIGIMSQEEKVYQVS